MLNSVVRVDAVYAIAVVCPIKPLKIAPKAPASVEKSELAVALLTSTQRQGGAGMSTCLYQSGPTELAKLQC
jgi:hypothetical protein